MRETIRRYQLAYNTLIDDLKQNDNVIGVTVFGSIITGDIWKNSDIDMFIILNEKTTDLKDIFGEKCGIDVHMKVITKEEFLDFRENFTGGSKLHRKLISSKLVIGKDPDVIDRYNYYKFLNDIDKDRWNLTYLGDLIRAIGLCEKAIKNNKNYNAIYSAMKLGESLAKIYLNVNGYLISSDPLTMAINLDDSFKICMDRVMDSSDSESVENLIEFTQMFLSKNIRVIAALLLKVLSNEDKPLSIHEIKGKKEFDGISIEMDKILKELATREIIKKGTRDCITQTGHKLIEELTYYYEK
ncbi:nucleotidyltransferase domain-containing protein [uncultured Clostridium sp.]|uniref:nucleotidyltransferase domain-containing protein n=1 Tax=uncultured Clostridium sp. TaxID=59620 RepID=UPI0026315576|nr:nucleotidyltransferase domain-containing protein [uncultured Clostridium sp.]